MTPEQIEELWCLQQTNDAIEKPCAIHVMHWDDGVSYRQICEAGYAERHARAKGFSKDFFAVKITQAGRDFIEANRLD